MDTFVSDPEVYNILNQCPDSSITGNELTVWDDTYFFKNHYPQTPFSESSQMSKKVAMIKLCQFFSGEISIYEKFVSDFRITVLSLRDPSNINKMLFQSCLGKISSSADNSTNETVLITGINPASSYIPSLQESDIPIRQDEPMLADSIETTTEGEHQAQPEIYNPHVITNFWNKLFTMLSQANDANVTKELKYAETIMSLLCLHCLKLINKTVASVFGSIRRNLNKHFLSLYKPTDFVLDILAPHHKSLNEMKNLFSSGSDDILQIIGMTLGTLILELNKASPSPTITGVLQSSCLTHLSMYGLAPIKHLEQAALALRMTNKEFCKLICTKRVFPSLKNVILALKMSNIPVSITVRSQTIELKSQISWRYCRLFNQNHFNRFDTKSNTRLIIRCAAYLSESDRGQQIANMMLLQQQLNKSLFNAEVKRAKQYIDSHLEYDDEGLTTEARGIYTAAISNLPADPFETR